MPEVPSVEQIAAAGPWPVLVFVLLIGIIALAGAIVKRIFVPGWLYDQLREDNAILRDQGERNAKAIKALVDELRRERTRKAP